MADDQMKDLGFIISGSWIDTDDIAAPLQNEQVHSRFGESNYIRLQNLGESETKEFVRSLMLEWIDAQKRTALLQQFGGETDGEATGDQSYPFTEPGLDIAVKYACRKGGYTTPRDIQKTLDDFANRAIDDKRHVLASSYVSRVINS
jgi:hypothetical protein